MEWLKPVSSPCSGMFCVCVQGKIDGFGKRSRDQSSNKSPSCHPEFCKIITLQRNTISYHSGNKSIRCNKLPNTLVYVSAIGCLCLNLQINSHYPISLFSY